MAWSPIPKHVEGRTRAGRSVHAVELDHREYDSWALCGVSCNTVDRKTDFDPLEEANCERCRVAVWRGAGAWVR